MKLDFDPVHLRPAYMQVFEAIESAILRGDLVIDSALPTESDLCEQFGVKRSTVREGIRLLEQAGLVRRVNARRLVIARPETEEAAERTSRGLERHGVRYIEVLDAITALQPPAARMAALNATDADLDELNAITMRLKDAETMEETVEHGVGYLFAIGRATHNRVVEVMLRSINSLAHTTLDQVIDELPEAKVRIIKAQTEITKSLRARERDRAEKWMVRHVEDLRRGYDLAGINLNQMMSDVKLSRWVNKS